MGWKYIKSGKTLKCKDENNNVIECVLKHNIN